ncbi:MAG: enoyl-CoA hydratase/isomerase family protein, partial [Betaproteobacteria bacterium]|nr:enoyl-CoA hydratase/isomerase family protein [Betaproteobacteria bacterium]
MSDLLVIERRLPAVIVRFNRPDKQNALSIAVLKGLDEKLAELDEDSAIRGIVLTGNDKVFSTGGDLKEALAVRTVPEIRNWLELFRRANHRIESISKPVVAAING